MRVRRIGHYNLYGSRSLIKSVKTFYKSVLGFTDGFRPDFEPDGNWLYIDESPLLHLTIDETAGDQALPTGNLHHIALDCSGLAAFREKLRQEGVDYHMGKVPGMKMTQLFIKDPAGICVELNFLEDE